MLDCIGEIVAVIGRPGRHIPTEQAVDHPDMNEGSPHAGMKRSVHAGRVCHASGSREAWIRGHDEVDDIAELRPETWVNGKVMRLGAGADPQ